MPPLLTLEWKERTQHHRASLPITDSTVRAALDLVSRVLPLKHRQLYMDGDHIDPFTVKNVLACYANGLTSSRMAYCWIAQPLARRDPSTDVVSCEYHKINSHA